MPYRPGAGRKKGSVRPVSEEVHSLLQLNTVNILNKAIALATCKEPNTAILAKLIDKILPTLTSGSLDMNAKIKQSLDDIPENKLKEMVVEFSKYAANAAVIVNEAKKKEKSESGK